MTVERGVRSNMVKAVTQHATVEQTAQHIHVDFSMPHAVLSSAALNGGIIHADHLVNVKVPKHGTFTSPPDVTLSKYCADAGWSGTTVGMMTAASMESFRMMHVSEQGVEIVVMATAGLSNARRVGDPAEHRIMTEQAEHVGTINIIVLTSAVLTGAASVEAVLMVTEAKTAALQDAGIRSPVSQRIATGTGTDAVAVVSGHGPEVIGYCGKHVVFGEILGRLVTNTVRSSIAWELEKIRRMC